METQETLFEPSEADLYDRAINQPLAVKIKNAIGLLQGMENSALNLSPDGYYLCFSGGKDSIVLAKLAELAGVKHTLNCSNTTIDPPELIYFIRKNYPQTKWEGKSRRPLPFYMVDKGMPPTRMVRWCCEIYKETGGAGLFKLIGVRAEESAKRKKRWSIITQDRKSESSIGCPILYWTDKDIWDFIKLYNMPYCELYDQGWKRLGCIGCPMSGEKGTDRDFAKWPRYKKLWLKGFNLLWKVHPVNGHFKTKEEHFDWWASRESKKGDNDCQLFLW